MLEVAVIGAGAAGLVTSRYLLEQNLKPIIFDAAKTLGGAWSVSSSSQSSTSASTTDGISEGDQKPAVTVTPPLPPLSSSRQTRHPRMWNGLHTNLSKYTCQFSDFPWPSGTSTFPSGIEMNNYLESYASEFLLSQEDGCNFQFQCQVTNVVAEDAEKSSDKKSNNYLVEWIDLTTDEKHSKEFDGVVVASGYFSKPWFPDGLNLEELSPPDVVIHSSDYVSPEQFSEDDNIAVIGNSFSALEIAVDVSRKANQVTNILPSIPWVLPRYVIPPSTSSSRKSTDDDRDKLPIPIDLALYQRTTQGPKQEEKTTWNQDDHRQKHEYLESIVGSKQSQITQLGIPKDYDKPPMTAISDYYLDLVQANRIQVCKGRFMSMEKETSRDDEKKESYQLCIQKNDEDGGGRESIGGITKVICCSGYTPNLESFLDPHSILAKFDYDPDDKFAPLTACWDTFTLELPNLALVGMTKGIYMGVMELQAKLAVQYILECQKKKNEKARNYDTDRPQEEFFKEALEISKQIRSMPKQERPQFPHSDYIGFMDSLSRKALKQTEYPTKENMHIGQVCVPAFYSNDVEKIKAAKKELNTELFGKNRLPSLVVSAMITSGPWKFQRKMELFNMRKTESVSGEIIYSRRETDLDSILYREDGLYEYVPGQVMEVFREYEYTIANQGGDDEMLEIYFVEGGKRAHLFLSLKFHNQDNDGCWIATSDHLCIKDLYKGTFKIKLDESGMSATEIIIQYRVRGPAKDYESTTILVPAQ